MDNYIYPAMFLDDLGYGIFLERELPSELVFVKSMLGPKGILFLFSKKY